jgi:hypothetical protein
MFLSSFEELRRSLFINQTIDTFIHNGRGVFGSDFGSCSFACRNCNLPSYRGVYRRLFDKPGSVSGNDELEQRFHVARNYQTSIDDLKKVPSSPVAYWIPNTALKAFQEGTPFSEVALPRVGMITGNNALFVRFWFEVIHGTIGYGFTNRVEARESKKRWFPYQKGGPFRRWYGNKEHVVDWEDDGRRLRTRKDVTGHVPAHAFNDEFIFQPNVNWSKITISEFSARITKGGCLFDDAGSAAFPRQFSLHKLAGFLNSRVSSYLVSAINPTVNIQAWDVGRLPIIPLPLHQDANVEAIAQQAEKIAREDWDSFETSWDFQFLPSLQIKADTLQRSQQTADANCLARFAHMKELEEENNCLFIKAYGLQDELSPEVPDDQITLYRPDREEDIKRLLSYAIGCMMGRYSLDKPGLIYAHSGNQDFDSSQYKTFRADDDGIIPLLETDWGIRDDAANRIVEFIGVAWPKEHLEENLKFIAESLGPNNGEQPRDTIRRYLATGFYKHHLSMYKKRPIYWLFSSGKQRAFQCLVYLHRYHEGTLARMRTEYVIPLQGQIAARIEQLEGDKAKATSTSHRNKLQKEQNDLKKQQAELLTFEEKLKHAADKKISLDLDDGVKVNYGKFGDLLAEVKAITGGKDEE